MPRNWPPTWPRLRRLWTPWDRVHEMEFGISLSFPRTHTTVAILSFGLGRASLQISLSRRLR